MSGTPVVVVTSGGIAVTEVENGAPLSVADNGYGMGVRIVASGGMPVTFVGGGAPAVPNGIIIDGTSIVENYATAASYTWPHYFEARVAIPNTSIGISGSTFGASGQHGVSTLTTMWGLGIYDTVIQECGTNDLGIGGATDTDLIARVQLNVASIKAIGYRVWVCTILPRNDVNWSPAKETYRLNYNSWLRANWPTFADGLLDQAALIPEMADPDAAVYGDKLHPSQSGVPYVAEFMIGRLGLPSYSHGSLVGNCWRDTPLRQTPLVFAGNKRALFDEGGGSVIATLAITGKKVLAVKVRYGGGFEGAGIAAGNATTAIGTDGTKSVCWYGKGDVVYNGVTAVSGLPSGGRGKTLGFVVDEPNGLAWYTVDGTAFYGATATALTQVDVEAGTGGFNIAPIKANGTGLFLAAGSSLGLTNGGPDYEILDLWPWAMPSGYANLSPPTLAALSLSAASIAENSAAGTVVGAVLGGTTGSTLSLVDDASGRFALNGSNQIVAGAVTTDYESSTSHAITIRETLAGATNNPHDTVLTVTVTDVSFTLTALALSSTTATAGSSFSATITNATAGSTITATSSDGTVLSVSGTGTTRTLSGTFSAAGTPTVTLTETIAEGANSPRQSNFGLTVNAGGASSTLLRTDGSFILRTDGSRILRTA